MTSSRDTRDFTDAEYRRELSLHHVEVGKDQNAGDVYRSQDETVTDNPKSGVFRDFAEYGVHPAVVVLLELRITIPFLTSLLTASQISDEITNQKRRDSKTKKEGTKWPEEKELEASSKFRVTPSGQIRETPSAQMAYMLIRAISEGKNPRPEWRPPMRQLMSALNFYYFKFGNPAETIPPAALIPPRRRAAIELLAIVPRSLLSEEIRNRAGRDPENWGQAASRFSGPSLEEMARLIADVMTQTVYNPTLRSIVDWYKTEYRRLAIVEMIQKILSESPTLVATVRASVSGRSPASHKTGFW